ncbi:MAG: GTPase Era [Nitrospinaceae bacterium]|nr:GTPase Era [Nitrospinaceae bacterium]MDP7147059.1 GTPase Era [Nitrospinaceae bacterium]
MSLKKEEKFKSGYAAIVGKPNVGKSTLLNRLVMKKIAAISNKPQTTRNKITGVVHFPGGQIILLDTPGIHQASSQLNRLMVKASLSTYHDVDLVLFVIDAKQGFAENDIFVMDTLKNVKSPKLLIINKLDLVAKPDLLGLIAEASAKSIFDEIIPVSALRSDGLEDLGQTILGYLPEGPQYFPEDMITDCSEEFLVEEIVREKIMQRTRMEIPYAVAVVVEGMSEGHGDVWVIDALIIVEKQSQKKILIGAKGAMLKKLGKPAREEIERRFGCKVYLNLFVKVKNNWREDSRSLRELGYLHDSNKDG